MVKSVSFEEEVAKDNYTKKSSISKSSQKQTLKKSKKTLKGKSFVKDDSSSPLIDLKKKRHLKKSSESKKKKAISQTNKPKKFSELIQLVKNNPQHSKLRHKVKKHIDKKNAYSKSKSQRSLSPVRLHLEGGSSPSSFYERNGSGSNIDVVKVLTKRHDDTQKLLQHLFKKVDNERHFYNNYKERSRMKSASLNEDLGERFSGAVANGGTQQFDILKEAIKLAQDVVKGNASKNNMAQTKQGDGTLISTPSVSIAPSTASWLSEEAFKNKEQSEAGVKNPSSSSLTSDSVSDSVTSSRSTTDATHSPAATRQEPLPIKELSEDELRLEVERKQFEQEKERLKLEREQLEKEKEQMKNGGLRSSSGNSKRNSSSKKDRHSTSSKSSSSLSESNVSKNDSDTSTENLENKLNLLEERLKNMDYKDGEEEMDKGSTSSYKNEIIPDEIEFAYSPVGDRAATGIPGLDSVIQGGLRRLSTTLIAGGPGSGKTIFAMQYIINGILDNKEAGIYISFEQTRDEILDLFSDFGWDLEKLEKENKLAILHFSPEQVAKMMSSGGGSLRDSIDSIHATRIVIDSLTDLMMLFRNDIVKRQACMDLFDIFKKLNCTTVCVSEQEVDPLKHISNVLEYQVDGVFLLYNERIGDIRQRAVEIFKMRGTKHAGRIFPMRITDSGVVILSDHPIRAKS